MREGLRILGLSIALMGAVTLLWLSLTRRLDGMGPAFAGMDFTLDLRSFAWTLAGLVYIAAGMMLAFLRRWAAVLFIVGAVLAAACMVYDMAAFLHGPLLPGVARVRADIASLVMALILVGLTVPLARRGVLQ